MCEPPSAGGRALPCYDTSLLTISVFIKRWDNLTLQSFQIRVRAATLHRCLARAAQSVQYKLKIMIASLNLNVFITINFLPKLQIALIIKFPRRWSRRSYILSISYWVLLIFSGVIKPRTIPISTWLEQLFSRFDVRQDRGRVSHSMQIRHIVRDACRIGTRHTSNIIETLCIMKFSIFSVWHFPN